MKHGGYSSSKRSINHRTMDNALLKRYINWCIISRSSVNNERPSDSHPSPDICFSSLVLIAIHPLMVNQTTLPLIHPSLINHPEFQMIEFQSSNWSNRLCFWQLQIFSALRTPVPVTLYFHILSNDYWHANYGLNMTNRPKFGVTNESPTNVSGGVMEVIP